MRVDREELLQALELCEPGLSRKEIVEQSTCFVFLNGYLMAYNDEVFCRTKSPLADELTGAVQGRPLLDLVRALPDKSIEIYPKGKKYLMVEGRNKGAGIRWEENVTWKGKEIERPKEWNKLHSKFNDAVALVQECAGKKQQNFAIICVHLVPEFVEAFDNHQAARYKVPTGVRESVLLKRDSLTHITNMDMTKFCETDNWFYFRNNIGFVLACRRWLEPYPDIARGFVLDKFRPITLPNALVDAANRAYRFSKENDDDQDIMVEVQSAKLRVKGTGRSGFYYEKKEVRYKGPPLKFYISPTLLVEIAERFPECVVGSRKLLVNGSKFKYVASLSPVEEE